MGCSGSSNPAQQVTPLNSKSLKATGKIRYMDNEASTKIRLDDYPSETFEHFFYITKGVKQIQCPPGMIPVVCLNYESFTIVASNLLLGSSENTGVQLPIIAANIQSKGRLMCFSHINILLHPYFDGDDNSILIRNSLWWLNSQQPIDQPVLLLNIPQRYTDQITNSLERLQISVIKSTSTKNLNNHKLIIMPSDMDLSDDSTVDDLISFVSQGGGIAVFYSPPQSHDFSNSNHINRFLSLYGLSFTYCSLTDDDEALFPIPIPNSFDDVREFNLVPLKKLLIEELQDNHIEKIESLDTLVFVIRYYIMVIEPGNSQHVPIIQELTNSIWSFLEDTNYRTEDGLCPQLCQSIVIVLLQDLITRLPVDMIPAAKDFDLFPGEAKNIVLKDILIDLKFRDETLISTGLWLPPGVQGTITFEPTSPTNPLKPNRQITSIESNEGSSNSSSNEREINDEIDDMIHRSDLTIQVGSHSQSLLTKPGPWLRWPIVVSVYPVTGTETKIYSPHGGIVYFAVSGLPLEYSRKVVTLRCHKCCRYPRLIKSKPEVWEKTKDNDIPWGEIVTKNIILTVPTKYIYEVEEDRNNCIDRLDLLIKKINKIMYYDVERPNRVVFDVETMNPHPRPDYPIMMNVNDINGILLANNVPNSSLFSLIRVLANLSLREGFFDEMTENALDALVATIVFNDFFPNFNLKEAEFFEEPPLYSELCEIHFKVNELIFPMIFKQSRMFETEMFDMDDDKWISFVKQLSHIGHRNFTTLFENSRPIPLNIASTLQGLPEYIPQS